MAFLQRLAESFREGITSFSPGSEVARKNDSLSRTLSKQSSKGRRGPTNVPYSFLEAHTRDAIAAFVQEKFEKGEAKPHVFTQFWLQFPKLEAGFEVLRKQLESRTGSREGPLPLAVLQSNPQDFGIDESSLVVRELCSKAMSNKCTDIDFIGLVMLLLVVHLTEPDPAASTESPSLLHPVVRTMLSCLELAFTHFNSAKKGKLDKREVAEALQHESAKAHTKEGARGRTGNRLAHRLFEGLDWEHDNTITFENFLRGILQLVQDEFGDVPDEEDDDLAVVPGGSGGASGACSGSATPSPFRQANGAAVAGAALPPPAPGGAAGPRRCGSSRMETSAAAQHDSSEGRNRGRSASATGMTAAGSVFQPGELSQAQRQGQGQGQESVNRSPSGGFLASLKGSLRKAAEAVSPRATPGEVLSPRATDGSAQRKGADGTVEASSKHA